MLQEFYVKDLIETIETDDIYNIMNKRMCKNLETSDEPLGPPDICYLVREVQNKSFLGIKSKKVSKTGAYHYVYGLDTSNVAYISAYISKYIQKTQTYSNYKISQSIFCAFDYFLEKDLRILIKFPGGIRKIFYIDETQAIEANPEELKTVFLSSVLRSWCFKTYPIPKNSLFLEEINSVSTFDYLIESIKSLISNKIEFNTKYHNFEKKLDKLLQMLMKFLIITRRFNFAILTFSKLSLYDYSLAKYTIEPLKILGLHEEALSYLANLLVNSSNPVLLSLEIDILTYLKQYEDSLKIAKFVTSVNPEHAENWLALAELYLRLKKYENCLRALNNIYFLKEFSLFDLNKIKSTEGIVINEVPIQKIKNSQSGNLNMSSGRNAKNALNAHVNIKMNDILLKQKNCIDIYYSSNQFYLCENSDFLQDTTMKILNCPYYTFDTIQKKAYELLLELIKEINFDSFIDLKRKNFCENNLIKQSETEQDLLARSEPLQISSELKISMNPYLEIVIDNLIEDLKIFSIVVSEDDSYFTTLKIKDDLSISEVKFCIAFGVLAERLKYLNTAMTFYTKTLNFSFSKFVNMRKILICVKEKKYKNAIQLLAGLLSIIPQEQFKLVNKTPLWIDKIILMALYEYQANEIIQWVNDYGKHIVDYFKKVITKYKYWIENGHEIHLIK